MLDGVISSSIPKTFTPNRDMSPYTLENCSLAKVLYNLLLDTSSSSMSRIYIFFKFTCGRRLLDFFSFHLQFFRLKSNSDPHRFLWLVHFSLQVARRTVIWYRIAWFYKLSAKIPWIRCSCNVKIFSIRRKNVGHKPRNLVDVTFPASILAALYTASLFDFLITVKVCFNPYASILNDFIIIFTESKDVFQRNPERECPFSFSASNSHGDLALYKFNLSSIV